MKVRYRIFSNILVAIRILACFAEGKFILPRFIAAVTSLLLLILIRRYRVV